MILRTEELNNGYLQLVYIGLEYGQGEGTAVRKSLRWSSSRLGV